MSPVSDPTHDGPRLVLAVLGLSGTGKSQAVEHLRSRLDAGVVYFGGVVVDEVRRRGLDVNEENERTVRKDLRDAHGMGVMAARSLPVIQQHHDEGRNVIIDGLYSGEELRILTESCPGLVTVSVHADRPVREARLASREVRPLTAAEMAARDQAEIRQLDKAEPIVIADHHVVNNGTVEDLHAALDAVLDRVAASTSRG